MDDLATAFVDSMSLDTLITWAAILSVPHDKHSWLDDEWPDDEWPDKEDDLRVAVAEAMLKVGAK